MYWDEYPSRKAAASFHSSEVREGKSTPEIVSTGHDGANRRGSLLRAEKYLNLALSTEEARGICGVRDIVDRKSWTFGTEELVG